MGGGGGTPQAASTVSVPTAADEEASAERARLYGLLRNRRGASGLLYGARPRVPLLQTKAAVAAPAASTVLWAPPWDYGGGGDMGGGLGGGGGDMGGGGGGSSTDSPGGRGDSDGGRGHGGAESGYV